MWSRLRAAHADSGLWPLLLEGAQHDQARPWVVGELSPDKLHLSVAAPPRTEQDALLVAAEHFAFCPDNIWQGQPPFTLAAYADRLIDAPVWSFWWD